MNEYNGKYFYEVVKEANYIKLLGPLDTIYFAKGSTNYAFLEVINNQVLRVFTENEILVTDKVL